MENVIDAARSGSGHPSIEEVARREGLSPRFVMAGIAAGTIVIPCSNASGRANPCGVGRGLTVKVNANIGSSADMESIDSELSKLDTAVRHGADTVMDLSTGPRWREILGRISQASPVPLGTVPLYQVFGEVLEGGGEAGDVEPDAMFSAVEDHCRLGVDFLTLHCGVTRRAVELLKQQGRKLGIVSRGGALMAEWMAARRAENPFYERFGDLIDILRRYDATFSLGDGLRPGCLADASDRAQIEELVTLGELQQRSLASGVQVMIEGPGHVPMNQIEHNIRLQKTLCGGAPFYVLGPIVTDIAPGYDHITSAIGGAMAAWFGADFLCYVTPAEHLRLPDVEDVRVGTVAARIAAHAADVARGSTGARAMDDAMAAARASFDWERQFELAIDPEKACTERRKAMPSDTEVCSMCGRLCAVKTSRRALEPEPGGR
ncbi:MAG TPA: phosphomethylpyrimidine synthase ThiC [Candidatus Fermentibacter daniensis]|nr:phosphomethylpyrimidine synthase ThiC [Candidatus Fermentibacter daniensis]HOR06576.1 phosphomethylpyrimidine synthase ThiC [Candidatus Fermentibacter daniensis]HPK50805.1 phosphomethylpyrimidine synthase ThiC [Candidatus Fermentibacter daniensis]HQE56004.1 phosphomethylpyrimidine synthase ThiC [Candidatus Fermentibacter daniensis]